MLRPKTWTKAGGPADQRDSGYTPGFFETQLDESTPSAEAVVPLLLELLRPTSVVDFGCGVGAWLAAFQRAGVDDIVGVDGPHVAEGQLQIPARCFLRRDLSGPIDLGRTFDVVMSLEVAEHLPPESAGPFVATLTKHAQVVVFSAAIPGQGGTHHVNEQWPSYWAAHFAALGWQAFDLLRPRIWNDSRVGFWYRQNILIFASPEGAEGLDLLAGDAAPARHPLDVVHPDEFKLKLEIHALAPSIRDATRQLGRAARYAARRRVRGFVQRRQPARD